MKISLEQIQFNTEILKRDLEQNNALIASLKRRFDYHKNDFNESEVSEREEKLNAVIATIEEENVKLNELIQLFSIS